MGAEPLRCASERLCASLLTSTQHGSQHGSLRLFHTREMDDVLPAFLDRLSLDVMRIDDSFHDLQNRRAFKR